MKNQYLTSALTLLCLFLFASGYSQDLDLIVTEKGDSIACRIDSITKTHIYFEMKSQNNWAQTHVGLTDVSEYKRNAIDKKQFVFKAGTSIIESPKPASPGSIRDIQRNSVYVGILTVNYSRMIPGDRVVFTVAGGLSSIDTLGVLVESTVLIGRGKHFFEPGIMGAYSPVSYGVFIRAGYRYQGPKGFLFRSALLLGYYNYDVDGPYVGNLLPALSIGYSF